jgi:hypothetical protein
VSSVRITTRAARRKVRLSHRTAGLAFLQDRVGQTLWRAAGRCTR